MRKKLGLGAGFALTAAVIAIGGCGSKKTTINGGTSGELNNNGFPASSIAQNNLAPDGGGFSENNQSASLGRFICKFNYPHATSDAASTADKSAMFLFVTSDNGSTGNREHVFVSYFNGQSFTPPQEITGEDRDESFKAGTPQACHASAAIMVPMNTSGYLNNAGAANARVRANAGNWLILWDGTTFTKNPALTNAITSGSSTTGVQTPDAVGPHHTVWATVFVKNLASKSLAITNAIGNTAASGTLNGPSIECHNGFQYMGTEVVANRNGASALAGYDFATNLAGGTGQAGVAGFTSLSGTNQLVKPAEDVASFAVASDTFVGCSQFGCGGSAQNGNDLSGILSGGSQLGNFNGGRTAYGTSTGQSSTNIGNNVFPSSASYDVGDNTSFIHIFYTQLVTSGTGANRVSTTFTPSITGNPSNGTVQLGPTWTLFAANFNLATMTVGGAANPSAPAGQVVVAAPATRNTFTDGRRASTQPSAKLTTYNNVVFWNYVDASLRVAQSGTSGNVEAVVGGAVAGGFSNILSAIAVLPGTAGDATIGNQNDITLLGSAGKHQTLNSQPVTSAIDVGEESVDLGTCSGCSIIGPDEGQQDIVAFVLGTVTTTTTRGGAAANNNVDQELWAVALTAGGANAGQLQAFTNNPKRISVHTPEIGGSLYPFPQSTNTNFLGLHDPVQDVKIQSSRDGTYYNLAWRQATGTSLTANLSLIANVYKVFRTVAAGTSGSGTVPTLDQRFPAAPIQVNTTLTAYPGLTTGVGTGYTGWWNSPPIAAYDFQGHLGYKCGFQSDRTKMSIFWLYSDGTNDRLFVKLLTVGTGTAATDAPTITATGETEIDATAAVPGVGVNPPSQFPNNTGLFRATFNFLPGAFDETIPNYAVNPGNFTSGGPDSVFCSGLRSGRSSLDSTDAGVNATGGGGDVLVVFSKVVSATDGAYDKQVIGALFNQTAISDRVVISRNFVESAGSPPGASSFNITGLNPSTYIGNYGGFKTQLVAVSPNTGSSSISTPARAADNGAYIIMNAPANTNASSASVLFARHFRVRKATAGGTAVTFANTFFPPASAATSDATFKNPVRIDNGDLNSNAIGVQGLTKGRRLVVLFQQDNHLWGTVTDDGETWTNNNGQPSAFLVDNNISISLTVPGNSIDQFPCTIVDSNCDNLSGTALFISKDDVNFNRRLYVRVMQ
jgi:hypothetical protein